MQAVAAKAKISPVKALKDRDVYYPGTEALARNEMRVVALGTGMPSARPKQAAACWLVELGNGDKFLFDIGSGCHERIAAQRIPYDHLDKIFIGHLHVDHMGYHFYYDFDIEPEVRTRVRKTYDGPLALALDYMVFNVTKGKLSECLGRSIYNSSNVERV